MGKQYPQIAKSWYNNWDNLMIFLQYPEAIRRIIYTTNSIESLNNQLRKVTKNKRVFPSDESVFKTLFLTIEYITRKWSMPIQNWNEAMAHFLIKFEDRIQINNQVLMIEFTQLDQQTLKNWPLALNQFEILCGDFKQDLLEHKFQNLHKLND